MALAQGYENSGANRLGELAAVSVAPAIADSALTDGPQQKSPFNQRGGDTMGSRSSWWRSMVMSFFCAAVLVIVQSFTSVSQAEAALTSANYFLQISGPVIAGESAVAGHFNDIDLLSFTMSFSQPVTPATCGNLRLLKNVDKASPQLVTSAILGTVHTQAVLSGVTKGGIVAFRMILTNVIVQSVNISDSSGVPPATEEVTLKAQSIVLEVVPENPSPGGAQVFTATIDCAGGGGA